jgi:hypothetical protein
MILLVIRAGEADDILSKRPEASVSKCSHQHHSLSNTKDVS